MLKNYTTMRNLYTLIGRNTHKTYENLRSFRSGFGKIAITFAFFLISITNSFSQCTNCAAQYPAATQSINAGVSNQNISTCMFGGDYAICNVVSGSTYTWTTCGDTDFDTQITVRNNDGTCTGALYAYNDDFCATQSQTSWTATFTGTVRVLVSKFSCANQSTCMTLNWSRSAPPCTVPSDPGFGNNSWNVIGYNGNDINLGAGVTRRGYYTESSLSFNSLNRWGTNDSPSNALGYNGCSVTTDNHTVVSKRTGVPTAGVYQIDVSTHDDAYLLLVNGSKSFENAYCCRTHSAIHTGYFNSSTTFEMRNAEGVGGSNQGLTYTLQNLNATVAQTNPTTCGSANGSILFSNPTGIVTSPVFKSSFDNANGLTNYGNATVTGGTLRLTSNSNSLWGVSVLTNSTNMNASSFNAEFDFRVWGGGGADGFSFNYAPSYLTANTYGNYESGIGNGLSICFYTYTGSGGPGLKIMYQGAQVGSSVYLTVRDAGYRQCVVSVNSNNQISVSVNGTLYISNLTLPAAFSSTDKTNWQFGFAARTGGVSDNHNIDNVSINALNQYEFSIDGTNWSSNMQFNNLSGGTYTPSIRNKAFPSYPATLSTVTLVNPTISTAAVTAAVSNETCAESNNGVIDVTLSGGLSNVRYVMLKQNKTDANAYINLAELKAIEIFTGNNVALNKVVTFNSVYSSDYPGSELVNNIIQTSDDMYHSGGAGTAEWVQVDLGAAYSLDNILIYNRNDCCWDRASNLQLILKDAAGNIIFSNAIDAYQNLTTGAALSYNVLDVSWNPTSTTLDRTGLDVGSYILTYAQAAGGCNAASSVTNTWSITTTNPANTAGTASSTPTLCINTPLTNITRTTTGTTGIGTPTGLPAGVSAAWTSNVLTISGTPTASGIFNYSIPLIGGCGTVSAIGTITVNPTLTASVSISTSTTTICAGTSVTFTATPTNGGALPVYQWKLNNVNVGTNSTTYANAALVNGDVVTCVLTSNATPCLMGSSATSNTVTMIVNALPNVSAGPDKTICIGNSVTLSGSGASGYTWSNGATTATQTVSPTTTATFTLTGTDGNGCTNTDQVVVTLPTAGTALSQNDENATCLVSENGWIDFYHSSGRLIGSINAQGQDLGNVTITSYVDPTNALIPACINPTPSTSTTVMQRHWVITPTIQPTSNVLIRLPYSTTEFNLLAFEAFNNSNLDDDLPA